jgi:hypothetical protein
MFSLAPQFGQDALINDFIIARGMAMPKINAIKMMVPNVLPDTLYLTKKYKVEARATIDPTNCEAMYKDRCEKIGIKYAPHNAWCE